MNEQEREAREFKHIRENDPGFVAPHRPARRHRDASFWLWIGVGFAIILLLIWLTVAMFTGDTDVNLITPFPWA